MFSNKFVQAWFRSKRIHSSIMRALFAITLAAVFLLAGTSVEAKSRHKLCRGYSAQVHAAACKKGGSVRRYVSHKSKHRSRDHDNARDAVKSGNVLPLSTILSRVRRRYPGKLLDARLGSAGNRYVYSIKLRDSRNRIKVVRVDAQSGRILSVR